MLKNTSLLEAKLTACQHENITFIKKSNPTLLVDNMILVSGEIARTTDFKQDYLSTIQNEMPNGKMIR
jgi:hypothetical protein